MKRIPVLLLCLLCLILGFALSAVWGTDTVMAFVRASMPQVAIIALVVLLLVILAAWVAYLLVRRWVGKVLSADAQMTETEMVHGLVDHFTTPQGVSDPGPEDRKRAAMINLGLWLARREAIQFSFNATVTVVGGLVGAATVFLLYEQNQKLDLQNERLVLQTDANIAESILLEGARRAALSGEGEALFDAIRRQVAETTRTCGALEEECWTKPGTPDRLFHLSSELGARTVSFSRRNEPYRIAIPLDAKLDFDTPLRKQYHFHNTSPERGALLLALVQQRVSVHTMEFSAAQMTGANLENAYLSGARLTTADFDGAKIVGGVFRWADLSGAFLTNAFLDDVDASNATLDAADLQNIIFRGGSLEWTSLRRANLRNAVFDYTTFDGADLSGAYVGNVGFLETSMKLADGFTFVWMWSDDRPPEGWPENLRLLSCDFDETRHDRLKFPEDCLPERTPIK